MAVPTFTSVSPTYGPAGGRNLVTIIGTNFRLPDTVENVVRVEFDGIRASRVDIMSTTELRVVPPAFRGTGTDATADPLAAIDIVITNLDDGGSPIGGESITATDAYTYRRHPIRSPNATLELQALRQVINEVVENFRRQVVPNVAIGTNVDYGALGDVVILATEHPSISLVGPRVAEETEYRHIWEEEEQELTDPADMYWPAYVSNIEFDLIAASDNRGEMFGITEAIIDMFSRTPYIEIPTVFGDMTSEMHRFPLVLTTPPATAIQNPNSNLTASPGVFEVRRIPYRLNEAIDKLYPVTEGNMLVNQLGTSEANEETVTFADSD